MQLIISHRTPLIAFSPSFHVSAFTCLIICVLSCCDYLALVLMSFMFTTSVKLVVSVNVEVVCVLLVKQVAIWSTLWGKHKTTNRPSLLSGVHWQLGQRDIYLGRKGSTSLACYQTHTAWLHWSKVRRIRAMNSALIHLKIRVERSLFQQPGS